MKSSSTILPAVAMLATSCSFTTARPQDPQIQQPGQGQALSAATRTTSTAYTITLPAASTTTLPPLPLSTGNTYTIYNASINNQEIDDSSYFQLVCSGAQPGAALVNCQNKWDLNSAQGANPLYCDNTNVNVSVATVGDGLDVHITLK